MLTLKKFDDKTRADLRIIALIHDSLKYKIDPSKNRTPTYHHGFLARKFAEKYINDNKHFGHYRASR